MLIYAEILQVVHIVWDFLRRCMHLPFLMMGTYLVHPPLLNVSMVIV